MKEKNITPLYFKLFINPCSKIKGYNEYLKLDNNQFLYASHCDLICSNSKDSDEHIPFYFYPFTYSKGDKIKLAQKLQAVNVDERLVEDADYIYQIYPYVDERLVEDVDYMYQVYPCVNERLIEIANYTYQVYPYVDERELVIKCQAVMPDQNLYQAFSFTKLERQNKFECKESIFVFNFKNTLPHKKLIHSCFVCPGE